MSRYSLSHLSDGALLRDLSTLVSKDRATTAELLANLAETDERKLYLPAGYPSLFSYCVGELRMSEDVAIQRIQAARVARRFPAVFELVSEGRLTVSGVRLLAPHLTPGTAAELITAAAGKTKLEIEELLAARFPRAELLPLVATLPSQNGDGQHAPGHVGGCAPDVEVVESPASSPARDGVTCEPTRTIRPAPSQKVTPIAAGRVGWQFSSGRALHDKFRRAQGLMNSTDIEQVLGAALDLLNEKLAKQKCGATSRPRIAPTPSSKNPRHIPNAVRRAVWKWDKSQCSFVSDSGHRCEARMGLELDHVVPVARGGTATLDNMRLLCRAHNQHAAECAYGAAFMNGRREAATEARRKTGGTA